MREEKGFGNGLEKKSAISLLLYSKWDFLTWKNMNLESDDEKVRCRID